MPTPTKGPRLGGSPAHQRLLLANLATQLFEHGRITTTEAKAKALRPLAEKLITFAKKGDIHARRQVLTVVRDKDVVHHLFAEIGPRFANRPGGYTRIVKVGPRKGDNAPMAQISLVEALSGAAEAEGIAKRAAKEAAAAAAAEAAAKAQVADTATEAASTDEGVADNAEVNAIVDDVELAEANDDAAEALAEATGTEESEVAAEAAQADAVEQAVEAAAEASEEISAQDADAVAAVEETEGETPEA